MEKIPTAEEYLDGYLGNNNYPTDTPDALIEFAKLHVKAALENVQSKLEYYEGCNEIKDLYSLTNIK